jgi:hypothetical protein
MRSASSPEGFTSLARRVSLVNQLSGVEAVITGSSLSVASGGQPDFHPETIKKGGCFKKIPTTRPTALQTGLPGHPGSTDARGYCLVWQQTDLLNRLVSTIDFLSGPY